MREMMDSGIEWIGDIPSSWALTRVKYVSELNPACNASELDKDSVVTYTPMENIKNGYFINSKAAFKKCLASSYTMYEEGDIVIAKVTPCFENGNISIMENLSNGFGFGSSELFVERPFGINSRYLFYWFQGYKFIHEGIRSMKGTGGLKRVTTDFMNNSFLCLPPINEQKKIVNFLDSKCFQINEAIRRQESIIEKLKEYRHSVITEAVTKGLDPNKEMKDSGNQFIGLIPKHWIVVRLKHLLVEGSDGIKIGPYGSALKGKTQPQGPFKIYNQANVISGDFSLCRHFISAENYKALSSYTVKAGDVLFSMMGTIGKCRIMPDGQTLGIMDSHLLKARLNNKELLPNLFCYIYDKDNNPSSFAQMLFETQGSIMNGLNSEIVKNLWLAYPPDLKEQQEITKYLDSKCSQIDEAIHRHEKLIDKLKFYRQSLIYEVVTGKKDVV